LFIAKLLRKNNTLCEKNVKVKFYLSTYAMKIRGGGGGESRDVVPTFLNRGNRCKAVVNYTHRPLYPREKTLVPIEREAAWAPEPCWTFGGQKNLLPLPGFEFQTVQLVGYSL
jgi:hypothetical protein